MHFVCLKDDKTNIVDVLKKTERRASLLIRIAEINDCPATRGILKI